MIKLALACAAALALVLPATAGAATVTREHYVLPITGMPVTNPCTGETVTLTGEDIVDSVFTEDGTRSRISVTDRWVGQAVSASGATYRYDDTSRSTTAFTVGRPGGALQTHVQRLKQVGGGPAASDFTLMTAVLVVWDGAGTTLVSRDFVRTRCR